MKLRVGAVNFLNAYPLWADLKDDPSITLSLDTPANLARQLQAGDLDVALISSIEVFRSGKEFGTISGLGIIADKKSDSIRLFLREAPATFGSNIHTLREIFTDSASRSSVAQLQIILNQLYWRGQLSETDKKISLLENLSANEGLLAIGDFALKNRSRPSVDVQSIYYDLFRQPMVYALWCYRKINPPLDLSRFMTAYRTFMMHRKDEVHQAAKRFGFDVEFCDEYLNGIIRYELDESAMTGLEFFKSNVLDDRV